MELYPQYETDTSLEFLENIITIMEEPICLLGGWAVYFTVDENIRDDIGMGYLGSRDIDLGFHIKNTMASKDLNKTPLAKALRLLEKHGFMSLGSRYYKDIDIETGKELTKKQATKLPTHNIFQIFVDIIVDAIHPAFNKTFNFVPIDESLLKHVFSDTDRRIELKKFDKLVWIPTPEILLASKIKSLPQRTKDNKKVKDVCDIYSLGWYSGEKISQLKQAIAILNTRAEKENALNCIKTEKNLLIDSQNALGIDKITIENLLISLFGDK